MNPVDPNTGKRFNPPVHCGPTLYGNYMDGYLAGKRHAKRGIELDFGRLGYLDGFFDHGGEAR